MDNTEAPNKTHTVASPLESHETVLSDNYNGNSGIAQALVTPMETISCAIESDTTNSNCVEASNTSMPAPVMVPFLRKDKKQETEKTSTSTVIGPPVATKPVDDNSLLTSKLPYSIISYQRRKNKKNTGVQELKQLQKDNMGRSRGNFHSANEDPTQRSRRKRNVGSGKGLESSSAGQGTTEGKKAFYHCNYCNKDISEMIRIKCAVCPDFDLCVECFSVGAEVTPHKSNHPYRVMDNLSFPLLAPDWNADEEMLLLEGLEMYGFGNWAEVAEHVGTKSKEKCIEHYTSVYLNSPCFPLPDMSLTEDKNRDDLLAIAKEQGDDKKGSMPVQHVINEESAISPSTVRGNEMDEAGGPSAHLPENANADPPTDGNSQEKKPETAINEGSPSLAELSGYNPKRMEFDVEYDNDAEQLLAEMEFKDTDTEEERELKLRVLRSYSRRLDERQRRKEFILERNLLHPNPIEKDLTPEERELCRRYDVFMRFHTKEEHDDLLQTVIAEHRTLKRIQELKEAYAAGCRSSAQADRYIEQKRKWEAEESARRAREGGQAGSSSHSAPSNLEILDFQAMQWLSEAEKRLCAEIRLPPKVYLKMLETMSKAILSGTVTKKPDAHGLFNIDSSIVDRVYDMLVKKGIAPP